MDRIVIVTGGTKGIGFATAKKFLSCKDKVIILGRHECEDAVKELQKEGEVTFMKADVSVVDDCCHVVSAVMENMEESMFSSMQPGLWAPVGILWIWIFLISRTPLTSILWEPLI